MNEYLEEHAYHLDAMQRTKLLGHPPLLIWFTGLSGSGKSTLADELETRLLHAKIHAYHLDGDAIRRGLNVDLGFSAKDRDENVRRVGEMAALMLDAGLVVITALISPMQAQRDLVRVRVGAERFVEVHVSTPLSECERRDIKGYYAKARSGEIKAFTGVSAPYEVPENPDLRLDTSKLSVDECMLLLEPILRKKGLHSF